MKVKDLNEEDGQSSRGKEGDVESGKNLMSRDNDQTCIGAFLPCKVSDVFCLTDDLDCCSNLEKNGPRCMQNTAGLNG